MDEIVVLDLCDGIGVLERIEPAGIEGDVHRNRQRALGLAAAGLDLGILDVEVGERTREDRGWRRLLRDRRAQRYRDHRQRSEDGNTNACRHVTSR
jgi:hypothetical protein